MKRFFAAVLVVGVVVATSRSTDSAAAAQQGAEGEVQAKIAAPAGADKGAAEYDAFQVPSWVIVTARGRAPTPGHKLYLWQLPLKIFPPQFELLWVPPQGPVIQVLHPFHIATRFRADKPVESLIVHDREGRHEVKVQQVPDSADQ